MSLMQMTSAPICSSSFASFTKYASSWMGEMV